MDLIQKLALHSELKLKPQILKYRERWRSRLQACGADELIDLPRFLNASTHQKNICQIKAVLSALQKTIEFHIENNLKETSKLLVMPELNGPLYSAFLAQKQRHSIARPDCYYTRGQLVFLEQNMSSTIMGFSQNGLSDYFKNHPVIQDLQKEYEFSFFSYYDALEKHLKELGWQNKLIVLWGLPKTKAGIIDEELSRLCSVLKGRGFNVKFPDPTTTWHEIKSDGLYLKGEKVDILYRLYSGLKYFLETKHLDILSCAMKGQVEIFCDPTELLSSNKRFLAFLNRSENQSLLSSEEHAAIKSILPETGLLENASKDFLIRNKNELVLKAGIGVGGETVMVGRLVTDKEWEASVLEGQKRGDIIYQKYFEADIAEFPVILDGDIKTYKCSFLDSPFLLGSHVGGYLNRTEGFVENVSKTVFSETTTILYKMRT